MPVTHVAGILASSGILSGGRYAGVAPGCQLYILKVLDEDGNGQLSHVLDGFRWLMQYAKQEQIRIVNVSVGAVSEKEDNSVLLTQIEQLWDAGLCVYVSAGNEGPGDSSVTVPGTSPKVITVGSSNDLWHRDDGRQRHYSGRGPTKNCIMKPELVLPGSHIVSCNAFYRKDGHAYCTKSGTSMAAPMAAGAAALLLEREPELSNGKIKLRMRENCKKTGLPSAQQGWGVLDIRQMVGN